MTGFIYAIGDGEGRVKLGWSANPIKRRAAIDCGCPSETTLLGFIPATRAHEAETHALLAPWRLSGEWFRLEGPVAAFVDMLPAPRPWPATATPVKSVIASVPDVIDAFGGITTFAKIIEKGASTASEMKRNRSIHVDYWPRIIEAAAERGIDGVTADSLMRLHAREEAAE